MKKYLILFGLLVMISLPVFCQVEPPADFVELLTNIKVFLGSFWGVVVLTAFLTAFVLRYWTNLEKVGKYLLTLIASIVVALLAHFIPFGYLHETTILYTLLSSLGIFAVESLGFSIPSVRNILEGLIERQRK